MIHLALNELRGRTIILDLKEKNKKDMYMLELKLTHIFHRIKKNAISLDSHLIFLTQLLKKNE